MVEADGTTAFFHQDKSGSVIAMSDTSGVLTEGPYTYDAYGNCVTGSIACSGGVPYKYTGRRLDPETRLYYYRARYYSSAIGRFLQTDPVGYKDDINWYTYVGNDPTDRVDPTGTEVAMTFYKDAGLVVAADLTTGIKLYASAFSGNSTSAAIPAGTYAVLAGKDPNHYRLEANDSHFGDDRTDGGRSELRFHPHGQWSLGCITCHYGKGGDGIGGMLQQTETSTTTVESKSRNFIARWLGGGKESITKYGDMTVVEQSNYRVNPKTNELTQKNDKGKWVHVCNIQKDGTCK